MKIIILNGYSSDVLSYIGGLVSVPAYGSLNVPMGLWIRLYGDIQFLSDLRVHNIEISDGASSYKNIAAEEYIKYAISRIDFTPIKKDFSFSSTQTNTVLWAPASGKKFVITDYAINIRNNTLGSISITIFDESNTSGNILYKANFEAGTNYDNVCNFITSFQSSAVNRSLKITTSGGLMISGSLIGYETE